MRHILTLLLIVIAASAFASNIPGFTGFQKDLCRFKPPNGRIPITIKAFAIAVSKETTAWVTPIPFGVGT